MQPAALMEVILQLLGHFLIIHQPAVELVDLITPQEQAVVLVAVGTDLVVHLAELELLAKDMLEVMEMTLQAAAEAAAQEQLELMQYEALEKVVMEVMAFK